MTGHAPDFGMLMVSLMSENIKWMKIIEMLRFYLFLCLIFTLKECVKLPEITDRENMWSYNDTQHLMKRPAYMGYLHWLPVSQRIVFKLMLIVHKSVNNIAPIYISELIKVYTPSRNLRSSNLRSSNMSLLKEPTSKRTWGDRSFSVATLRLWNHLPTKLKSCHSITRFKSLLKTHLMSQFFKDDVYL